MLHVRAVCFELDSHRALSLCLQVRTVTLQSVGGQPSPPSSAQQHSSSPHSSHGRSCGTSHATLDRDDGAGATAAPDACRPVLHAHGGRHCAHPPSAYPTGRHVPRSNGPANQAGQGIGSSASGSMGYGNDADDGCHPRGLERLLRGLQNSEQIGNLFQVHTAKFKDYVAEANEGVREAIVQVAATVTLLEPLRDLAQPLHDLVKPLQALVTQLKTVFSEAVAPCNKNLALLQKKVDEELAKTVTQVTEILEQAKTSFASTAEGEFKKVIEHIDWKVMSKLQGMANSSSERVESQQAEQTALIKSHTGLLSSFRTTLAEFGEAHKTNLQGVQDLAEDIGRMGEGLAENTEALQQTKEAIGQLSDSLQVLREAVMRGMPPYRPPPMAAPAEGGIPIRLDEAIRAASSRGPQMMYSVGSNEGPPATIDTNVLLLRILEQMVPGQHIVTRGDRQ